MLAACLLGFRRGGKSSRVAQSASDTPPSSTAGCWLSRSSGPLGGRRACHDSIQPAPRLPGAAVIDVSFSGEGVIVTVRSAPPAKGLFALRADRPAPTRERPSPEALASSRPRLDALFIECQLRRLCCPDCGAQFEMVPWARPGSRYTRDFEDVAAWLTQQMAKTQIARLLRVGWDTVGKIVERVVADHLDERRLDGLVFHRSGRDQLRRRHRYLTCVVDHELGRSSGLRLGATPRPCRHSSTS